MLKATYLNFILYFVLKYLLFYVFLMIKNSDYALLGIDTLSNAEDWFYYLWVFLFLPVSAIVLFSIPMYLSFTKIDKLPLFSLSILGIFVIEYLFYTYTASPANVFNGVFLSIIGLALLLGMFKNQIMTKLQVS